MRRTDIRDIPGQESWAVAIVVAAICVACVSLATEWQRHFPVPVTYAKAAPPQSIKKADRIEPAAPRLVPIQIFRPRRAEKKS